MAPCRVLLFGCLIGQIGRIGQVGLWFPEKGCSALPCSAGGSVESDIFCSFAVREAVENIDYLENKFWALA